MAGIQPVSFTSPYAQEEEDIARRRRMAEALQAQGMAPDTGTQMVGGWAIPKSPFEGLAKAAQSASGAYQGKRADEMAKALRDRQQGDVQSDMQAYIAALRGQEAQPAIPQPPPDLGGGPGAPAQPARSAGQIDPSMISQLRSPQMQNMALQQIIGQMKPPEPYTLSEGAMRFGPDGKPIASNPKSHPLHFANTAGGIQGLDSRTGLPVGPAQASAEKDEAAKFNAILTGAGIDPSSPAGQQLFKALAMKTATHQPPTQVVTNVSTEKKYGEQFAGQIAQADSAMRDAAIKAPQLAERAGQVKKLLAEGKVLTGSGADFRLSFAKAAQLAGLGNGTAADTEQVAVALSQNTLDAIKASGLGSGSGFSNADRDFLEKAVGGKITLEKATLERLADLSHKAAKATADKWNTRVKEIPESALAGTGIKRDAIEIPAMYGAAPATGLSPEAQRLLDKYAPQGAPR